MLELRVRGDSNCKLCWQVEQYVGLFLDASLVIYSILSLIEFYKNLWCRIVYNSLRGLLSWCSDAVFGDAGLLRKPARHALLLR